MAAVAISLTGPLAMSVTLVGIALLAAVARVDTITQLTHSHRSTLLERVRGIEAHQLLGSLIATNAQTRCSCRIASGAIGTATSMFAGCRGQRLVALSNKALSQAIVLRNHVDVNKRIFLSIRAECVTRQQRADDVAVRAIQHINSAEHDSAIIIERFGFNHDTEHINRKLKRGVHLNVHESRRRAIHAIGTDEGKREQKACGPSSDDTRSRATPQGGAMHLNRRSIRPPLPLFLEKGQRASAELIGSMLGIVGLTDTLLKIGHERASFSVFLPRAIQEYTVFTGVSSIEAISGAV